MKLTRMRVERRCGYTWVLMQKQYNLRYCHISGGPWRWLDGSTFSFQNWDKAKNEPNMNLSCATMNDNMNRDKGLWWATDCESQGRRVMCKSQKGIWT